ncbi:MAG: hypothetical protein HYY24_22370 [Verrucomicrobia bacterium]|nr:hypothetical protein [Verrucomicrobiota bacterium]
MRQPRYSREEFAQRGSELYERDIRPKLEAASQGRIVAIDIESGAFAVADDTLSASESLLSQRPDAQIWLVRVGYRGVHRFGPRAVVAAE